MLTFMLTGADQACTQTDEIDSLLCKRLKINQFSQHHVATSQDEYDRLEKYG